MKLVLLLICYCAKIMAPSPGNPPIMQVGNLASTNCFRIPSIKDPIIYTSSNNWARSIQETSVKKAALAALNQFSIERANKNISPTTVANFMQTQSASIWNSNIR